MNVSILELSKELYELSNWDSEELKVWCHGELRARGGIDTSDWHPHYPAYDAGYLLRKIFKNLAVTMDIEQNRDGTWTLMIDDFDDNTPKPIENANSPEDALCKLAIELFKQNILTKDSPNA